MKSKAMWISCILAALLCGRAANATAIMTLEQVGPNVVATGSGTVNLTDLTLFFDPSLVAVPVIFPSLPVLRVGGNPFVYLPIDEYYGSILGPVSFGSGGSMLPSTATGDLFGVTVFPPGLGLDVPRGYVSGTPLFGTATWDNTTLAALGATVGTYTWTWGIWRER